MQTSNQPTNERATRGLKFSWVLMVLLVTACGGDDADGGAGVGGSRDGCGEPGSHSVTLGQYSCTCEPGYEWCSEALDSFECCAGDDSGTGEEPGPDQPCDEDLAEQLLCELDPEGDPANPDPGAATVWACNGVRWVDVPGYPTFACLAEGFAFAYGCFPGPTFLCSYGPGSPCDAEDFASVCVDEDIIDACVWGRRTIERCSRLCSELEAFGPGFGDGACEQPVDPDTGPASCVCS